MIAKLGIIAGGGSLPGQVAASCVATGRPVFVIGLEGHADPAALLDYPHCWCRIGAAGAMIARLRDEQVQDLVMIGPVRRPSLAELRPDWRAARLLARVGGRALGDDGLLRAVAGELEREGFRVVGVHDLLRDLVTPAGVLGAVEPDAVARSDIAHGIAVGQALGRLDIGQAVVVQQGLVLGVEAIEGTAALLERCASLRRDGPGGVLVKLKKPQQDPRVDLPSLGTATIEQAVRAGLRGIAAEAGGSLLLGRDAMIALADRGGLFLVGVDAPAAAP
ncbi:MAG: UDP-2,3-diacylglucosamine diphosphatase LpxI [Azospirillaceae bacterium]|nr:UDP-2,3-diacylglucosamine diphosphatase LpxI [Azospirillaceae bacterium]